MADKNKFPHLVATARRLGGKTRDLSVNELRELLCHDCEFWHDGHEEELECSSFKMLRGMLKQGSLTPARLAEAVAGSPGPGAAFPDADAGPPGAGD